MKQADFKPCTFCGKGMAHGHRAVFFRLSADYMVLDFAAIQRQHGMEMMMGQAAPLAQIMGPNQDLAKRLCGCKVLVCLDCATTRPIADLLETIEADTEEMARAGALP